MLVKELIAELSKLDGDLPVYRYDDDYFEEIDWIRVDEEIEVRNNENRPYDVVRGVAIS